MITTIAVAGYRSLRELTLALGPLTVVTGPNGSGKSSLYRSLRLLAAAARGDLVGSLAREGGLPSTLWAGPEVIGGSVRRGEQPLQGTRRQKPVSLRLGFAADDFGYLVDLGLPQRGRESAFVLDPEVKRELVWTGPLVRPASLLVRRHGPVVELRDAQGRWEPLASDLPVYDAALSTLGDPERTPELLAVRQRLRGWRFYDGFRVDAHAPARRPQVGTLTPVLADDGADLAAALQTIVEIGAEHDLDAAVADAFPGSRLTIDATEARFEVQLHQPGLLRPLRTAELSDGTLRYLLWLAVLLSPRPAGLMVLNEPETSLHPDLVAPLGRLIVAAARRTQVVVVTHADALVRQLAAEDGTVRLGLDKPHGETVLTGRGRFDGPAWSWGSER